jgi:hypothetical protein
MKILGLLVVIGLNISHLFSSALATEIDPFLAEANDKLPQTGEYYGFEKIWETMSPHLIEKPEYFKCALSLMCQLPEPPHDPEVVTGGWQCLLRKLLKAESINDVDGQKDALLSLLSFHSSPLKLLVASLNDPIAIKLVQDIEKAFPCAQCATSARMAYGLK